MRSLYLVAVVTVASASDDGAELCLGDGEFEVAEGVEGGVAPADVDVPFCGEAFVKFLEDLFFFFVGEASAAHGVSPSWGGCNRSPCPCGAGAPIEVTTRYC